jgi:hypothetical protein
MAPPDAHVVGKIHRAPIQLLEGTLQLANTGTTSSFHITGAAASKAYAALTQVSVEHIAHGIIFMEGA